MELIFLAFCCITHLIGWFMLIETLIDRAANGRAIQRKAKS